MWYVALLPRCVRERYCQTTYLSAFQHVVAVIPDTLSLARTEVLNVLQCNLKSVSYSARVC